MPADPKATRTRPPAVAGLFYPRDRVRLQTEVTELLSEVAPLSNIIPKALVAPHAGYAYSGRVAGAAFAKLRANAQTITRVVLIGPAHYVHLSGIAAPRVDAFETPIGRVLVDTETCSQIGHRRRYLRATSATSRWPKANCPGASSTRCDIPNQFGIKEKPRELERRLVHPQVLAFHPSAQIESQTPPGPQLADHWSLRWTGSSRLIVLWRQAAHVDMFDPTLSARIALEF